MTQYFTLVGVTLADGKRANITVRDGLISAIGSQVEGVTQACDGLFASPGFVDVHTHLREPGFEESETILTGSMAGVAGGYTALMAMANTNPVADMPQVVNRVAELGREAGLLLVQPVGAITKGLSGSELAPLRAMFESSANVRYFSDDGLCVFDRNLMRQALTFSAENPVVIAQHAQDPTLTKGAQMNDGFLADELGLKGWPAVAEESIIARDIELALETGGRLHICHLTTGAGLEVVRWGKSKGARITAEVTPHHLLLTEELASGFDATYKVNPPLRTADDVAALRGGLIDGSIDVVATDHAPHSIEKKECEWENAAFGMVGLETASSIALSVLSESLEGWRQRFVDVMSRRGASIAQLAGQGSLEVGSPANITLLNLDSRRKIQRQSLSKSLNNPFAGLELPGTVVHTIYQGRFTLMNGKVQVG